MLYFTILSQISLKIISSQDGTNLYFIKGLVNHEISEILDFQNYSCSFKVAVTHLAASYMK